MYAFEISAVGLFLGTLGAFNVWGSGRSQNAWIKESEERILHLSRYAGRVTPDDYNPDAEKDQALKDGHAQIAEMAKSDRTSRRGILLIGIGFGLQFVALIIAKLSA